MHGMFIDLHAMLPSSPGPGAKRVPNLQGTIFLNLERTPKNLAEGRPGCYAALSWLIEDCAMEIDEMSLNLAAYT